MLRRAATIAVGRVATLVTNTAVRTVATEMRRYNKADRPPMYTNVVNWTWSARAAPRLPIAPIALARVRSRPKPPSRRTSSVASARNNGTHSRNTRHTAATLSAISRYPSIGARSRYGVARGE